MAIESIGIVGYGQFGQFLAELAEKFAPRLDLKVFSHRFEPDSERFFSLEETCKSDLVIAAVAIRDFEAKVAEIVPRLGPKSVLVDVATVMMHTVEVLKRHGNGLRYLATHPMFGPYSFEKQGGTLEGLRIVLSDHTFEPETYEAIKAALEGHGLVVLEMSPEEHDRQIAETLFLTHYVGQIVTHGGFVRTQVDSVSFGYLMDAVESVRQDTALFQDVFHYNPFCREVAQRFDQAEAEVDRLIHRKALADR
ncbi:MAG: prephenate dehydrogenase/arogenate dehydrogenase family protein [Pseudomonadota bacterium]